MFRHHPAFAETGELEIAQRMALHHAALAVGATSLHEELAQRAVEAYLASMRTHWQPGPIEIGEGDHISVSVNGDRVKIEHEIDSGGNSRLSLDDGEEVHYPSVCT